MAGQNQIAIPLYYQNYRLENEFTDFIPIGKGGFGLVSSGLHRIDLKRYAIKKIELKDETDYTTKIRELQVWAKLDCSYFVQYRSSWLEMDLNNVINLYIQMDLCSFSMDLAIKKIKESFKVEDKKLLTQLPYYIVSELMIELLECVDYLHSSNPVIFHRDIKPDNILIRADNLSGRFLKLADFGLARFHDTDSSKKTYTGFVGTNRYMAPEIQQPKAKYGPKVDIFSIGIVFQEVFNYDLNRYKDLTKLADNYPYLGQLIGEMLDTQTSSRPTCKQILERKIQWAINIKEMSNVIRATVDPDLSYKFEEDFTNYFLQTKLKYMPKY